MTDYFDENLWGIFAMPVGLLLCFGPVVVAWMLTKDEVPASEKSDPKH